MRGARGDGPRPGRHGAGDAVTTDDVWIAAAAARRAARGAARLSDATAASAGSTIRAMSTRRYERPRVRAALGRRRDDRATRCSRVAGEAAAERTRSRRGAAAADRRRMRDRAAPGLLAARVRISAAADDRDAAVYALRILLAAVGGSRAPARRGAGRGPARRGLRRSRVPRRRCRATLVERRRRRHLSAARDGAACPHPAPAVDGGIWDGRYRHRRQARRQSRLSASSQRPQPRKPTGLPTLPRQPCSAHRRAGRSSHGHAGVARTRRPSRSSAPWARFLPSFDLAPARAVAG